MFIMDDVTGEQKTRQGDSYEFTVTGISSDWDVFYSVYKLDTREIMLEVQSVKENDKDIITVSASECDKLVVEDGKKSATYGWNVKRCKNGVEDTVIVVGKTADDINKIIVLPKTTEGE